MWQAYFIALQASPTSGQFIQNVQNETISHNVSKNGKVLASGIYAIALQASRA
jgi:hypothetical protein